MKWLKKEKIGVTKTKSNHDNLEIDDEDDNLINEHPEISNPEDLVHKTTFENYKKAKDWMKSTKKWIASDWYQTKTGRIKKLRCSFLPPNQSCKPCRASAYLFYNEEADNYELFESRTKHDHKFIENKTAGISLVTKEIIHALYSKGVHEPYKIQDHIKKQAVRNPHIEIPTRNQIYNYLSAKRRQRRASKSNYIIILIQIYIYILLYGLFIFYYSNI